MPKAQRVPVPEHRTDYETFDLATLTPHLAAEIRGLDLSKPLAADQSVEFRSAFLD